MNDINSIGIFSKQRMLGKYEINVTINRRHNHTSQTQKTHCGLLFCLFSVESYAELQPITNRRPECVYGLSVGGGYYVVELYSLTDSLANR